MSVCEFSLGYRTLEQRFNSGRRTHAFTLSNARRLYSSMRNPLAVKGLTTSKIMSGLTQQQKLPGHRVLLFLCYVGLRWSSLLKDARPRKNVNSTSFENFRLLLLKLHQALLINLTGFLTCHPGPLISEAEVSLLKKDLN